MPTEPRLSRRAVIATAVVLPGAVALGGCKDDEAGSGTPGAVDPKTGQAVEETPTVDPAVVASLSAAAAQVTLLSLGYTSTSRKFPALRTQLAAGAKYHASHLAKLKETAGVQATTPKAPAAASTSSAALAALAKQEKAAAAAHAAAAVKLSGAPARLLAMIAASELQLGTKLTPAKKKADAS
ncbi:cell division protein FtsK [Kribbella capetownensis]|uniref:Cell division protein FtsK n=1 Tax=Kribbella capetownensis TaxID=1572659 RepID=A0A4R0JRP3_9ACTN|nr:cell division protein FtsK [Kribbella capetownensis]TCC50043.1 cell division protein FtsK [Kribbella capetownensis]